MLREFVKSWFRKTWMSKSKLNQSPPVLHIFWFQHVSYSYLNTDSILITVSIKFNNWQRTHIFVCNNPSTKVIFATLVSACAMKKKQKKTQYFLMPLADLTLFIWFVFGHVWPHPRYCMLWIVINHNRISRKINWIPWNTFSTIYMYILYIHSIYTIQIYTNVILMVSVIAKATQKPQSNTPQMNSILLQVKY